MRSQRQSRRVRTRSRGLRASGRSRVAVDIHNRCRFGELEAEPRGSAFVVANLSVISAVNRLSLTEWADRLTSRQTLLHARCHASRRGRAQRPSLFLRLLEDYEIGHDRAARWTPGPRGEGEPVSRARASGARTDTRVASRGRALGWRVQAELGLDSGGTSQHLAALRRIGVVESRREGTSVYYRVDDERVFDLLAAGRGIISRQLAEQQSILRDLETS